MAFSYDAMGRMLTRTPYTSGVAGTATTFEWDGWDMIREVTPAGTYRYYAPQGEILTFDFTTSGGSPVTSTYNIHSDAIGSVRAITDSSGAVVAHYEYSAWGELLPSSSPLSIGFSYLFVGSLGVRWDATLGMHYMRQRWYDAGLQRFISRDPLRTLNRYTYCENNPATLKDPNGLQPLPSIPSVGKTSKTYLHDIQIPIGLLTYRVIFRSKCTCLPGDSVEGETFKYLGRTAELFNRG